mmetsp:Transcript_7330/g.21637  ORF Transcript_7330/g.21637 Transcript_7330/m.21637 type:complete len:217 (+) Transcript_7330:932-1582(+)
MLCAMSRVLQAACRFDAATGRNSLRSIDQITSPGPALKPSTSSSSAKESIASLPFQTSARGVKGPAPFLLRSALRTMGMMEARMMVPNTARISTGARWICTRTGSRLESSATKAVSMPTMAPRPLMISGARPAKDMVSAKAPTSSLAADWAVLLMLLMSSPLFSCPFCTNGSTMFFSNSLAARSAGLSSVPASRAWLARSSGEARIAGATLRNSRS